MGILLYTEKENNQELRTQASERSLAACSPSPYRFFPQPGPRERSSWPDPPPLDFCALTIFLTGYPGDPPDGY